MILSRTFTHPAPAILLAIGLIPLCSMPAFAQVDPLPGNPQFDAPVDSAEKLPEWDVPADTPATLDGGATLNPLLLEKVQDNTVGIEYQERPAYFYGLWLATQVKPANLTELAQRYRDLRQKQNPRYASKPRSEFPQFVDIFQHPEAWRGHAVAMSGYLRSLKRYDPGPNDLGINEVYEGWIFTEDSQSNPGVIVFTQKPEGLPLGADITEEIRLCGYFLKMYGYQAADTTRKAPLFLAGTVQWYPARAANTRKPVSTWVYAVLTAVTLIAVWGLWTAFQRPGRSNPRFSSGGRSFDEYPPQEFLGPDDTSSVEPHH
jgi:hypothetical protein